MGDLNWKKKSLLIHKFTLTNKDQVSIKLTHFINGLTLTPILTA